MTQELDPKKLRAIAEAATPGPWEAVEETSTWMLKQGDDPLTDCDPCSQGESPIKVETYDSWTADNGYVFDATINHTHHAEAHQVSPVTGNYDYEEGGILEERDVQFIATFDPPTVLTLLSRLEQAEQALGAAERQIAARTGETAAERIWRNRAEQAEQQVARVREFSRKMLQPHGQNVVVAARVVESLDRALDGAK